MIVVSETSRLNYLVLIGHVDVLPILFNQIVAPPAVVTELLHPGSPPPVHTWATSPPSRLEIVPPSIIDPALRLGAGETEAISVVRELNADMLLIDERKATAVAHRLGLRVVGTQRPRRCRRTPVPRFEFGHRRAETNNVPRADEAGGGVVRTRRAGAQPTLDVFRLIPAQRLSNRGLFDGGQFEFTDLLR